MTLKNRTVNTSPPPHAVLDFDRLRREGIEHIAQLGQELWTDFNAHDPGVTMLDNLCYALTDLGYRTHFPIEDLVSSPRSSKASRQFFSVADILSCNPVTLNDYRRLIIDIDGVKNAWLKENEKYGGLYWVIVELENGLDPANALVTSAISENIFDRLMKYRNLAEDFEREIEFVQEKAVDLCMDVSLEENADMNAVEAEIRYQLSAYFSPEVHFASYAELRQKGYRTEDIYQGAILDNGFLTDEILDHTRLRQIAYASDLYQLIHAVEGVKAVNSLQFVGASNEWCLNLGNNQDELIYKGIITFEATQIHYHPGSPATQADQREVAEKLDLLHLLRRKPVVDNAACLVPEGRNRRLTEFTSIFEEFPLTYRVGEGQIPPNFDAARRGQIKQLQGFLVFFEQLMVNYLVQLERTRDLLAVEQKPDTPLSFYGSLELQPYFESLIDGNDYRSKLERLTNPVTASYEKRNQLLDHLLARFGEQFSDYAASLYVANQSGSCQGPKIEAKATNLACKANFLSHIDVLSRDRGKGFNYRKLNCHKPDVWDSDNVSGYKARVAALLCLPDAKRKQLFTDPSFTVRKEVDQEERTYQLVVTAGDGSMENILLVGSKTYTKGQSSKRDEGRIRAGIVKALAVGDEPAPAGKTHPFSFGTDTSTGRLQLSQKKKIIASAPAGLDAGSIKKELVSLVYPDDPGREGFHIVEHILLRNKDMAPIGIDDLSGATSYSHWITVVVPANWARFKGKHDFFEQLLRREAPAHLGIRILWLGPQQLYAFEDAYLNWLYDLARLHSDECQIEESGRALVDFLNEQGFTYDQVGLAEQHDFFTPKCGYDA